MSTPAPAPRPCPICNLGPEEIVLADGGEFFILRTKLLKGHRERFMVVVRGHSHPTRVPEAVKERGIAYLRHVAESRIGLDPGYLVLSDFHSSIPDHWHLVACDLFEGDDYLQVVDTPRTLHSREHPGGLRLEKGEKHAPIPGSG